MAILEWADEFSVGIDLIDKQHKILIRAINLLAMSVEQNSSRGIMQEIFRTLRDYTDTHFAYEEMLFDRFGYPDAAAHKAEHQALLGQVIELERRWIAQEAEIGPEVLKFLVNWLRNHIMGSDQAYSEFLIAALEQQ